MTSQNRQQWERSPPTQPHQRNRPIDTYQWFPTVLRPDQVAHSTPLHQPIVEDVVDGSRTYNDADQVQIFPHSNPQFPNSNITYSSLNDYDYPTSFNMTARRSTHPFTPPSSCSDNSTLSSASSNFSTQTSALDQQCRRISSQQAFLEWEGHEALARANKRMATGMSTLSPFCKSSPNVWSGWGWNQASHTPNGIGRGLTPQLSVYSSDSVRSDSIHVTNWLPPQETSFSSGHSHIIKSPKFGSYEPKKQSSSPHIRTTTTTKTHPLHQDIRAQSSSSPTSYTNTNTRTPPKTSQSPNQSSIRFETFLESELLRRSIADNTIRSIRSSQARGIAQNKENARRTEWAKEVLLRFPIESAMCENLNPGSMMRAVAADGVFDDISAGLVG